MTKIFSFLSLLFLSLSVYAYDIPEKDWGLAIGIRSAKIPYEAKDESVQDFIPLMFYDGDIFFIRGLSGGIKLYNKNEWQISLLARYRYFDIPSEYQNLAQGNALDLGAQLKYRISDDLETNLELLTDEESRYYSSIDARYHWESGSWELFPYATLRYKSADFNDYYYGLDGFTDPNNLPNTFNNKIGSGFDLTLGSEVRYHVASNFYLLGRAQLTTLDSNTRDSVSIENGTYGEVYLGVALFNYKTKTKSPSQKAKPNIRVAKCWGSPTKFSKKHIFK
jgi:outer membrane protein